MALTVLYSSILLFTCFIPVFGTKVLYKVLYEIDAAAWRFARSKK